MSTKATTAAPQTPKGATLQDVTLLKAHKHAGTAHATGDKISVNAAEAKWLQAHGLIDKKAE